MKKKDQVAGSEYEHVKSFCLCTLCLAQVPMFTGINYDDLYYLVLAMSAKEYRSEEILVHGPKKGETGSYPENTTLLLI